MNIHVKGMPLPQQTIFNANFIFENSKNNTIRRSTFEVAPSGQKILSVPTDLRSKALPNIQRYVDGLHRLEEEALDVEGLVDSGEEYRMKWDDERKAVRNSSRI